MRHAENVGAPSYDGTARANFADPGYRSDGKKRYPLNTLGLAVAAWSYVNMPRNAQLYSYEQHERIKARITKALAAFDTTPKAGDYTLPSDWSTERVKQVTAAKATAKAEQRAAKKVGLPVSVKRLKATVENEPESLPPIRLLRAYAALGDIPMFEISTDDIRGFCVYVLLEDDRPIYVGQSINILGRLSQHLRSPEKGVRTTTMQILKVPTKPHMDELELRLIQLYQPEFNIIGKSIDSYLDAG